MSDLGTCWESGCGREGLEMMVWWRVASIDWFVWGVEGSGQDGYVVFGWERGGRLGLELGLGLAALI